MGVACGSAPDETGRVSALVTRPPKDTVRFQAPARASRCGDAPGSGVLLQGSTGGNGVIVWLRTADSVVSGTWPLLQRGDTISSRGATVAVRFMVGDIAHGAPLDSGAVEVRENTRLLTVVARGTGLEPTVAGRVTLEATFDRVALDADTVPCRPKPLRSGSA